VREPPKTHTAEPSEPTTARPWAWREAGLYEDRQPGRRWLRQRFSRPPGTLAEKEAFMAIYHLRFGVVQRSKGQSVVAVAADRARVRLHDQRLDHWR